MTYTAVNPEPVATEPPDDDLLDMDLAHDLEDGGLGSGNWLRPHQEWLDKGGGYSENDLNPSLEEREEAAEMEER
jgi:hypothetical protein